MHDLTDILHLDAPDIPVPELEAAQVGKRIRTRDDHGCIDSYITQKHWRYDEC